jgi:hypothetical protein
MLSVAVGTAAPLPATGVHDNGPVVNGIHTGVGGANESIVQIDDLGISILGYSCAVSSTGAVRVADDFEVVAGPWQVDRVVVYGYEANPPNTESTVSRATVRIWDGPPGEPGSTVVFGDTNTDRHQVSFWIGAYRVWDWESGSSTQRPIQRVEIEVGTALAEGTYWLDWGVTGIPGGAGFSTPFVTINGVADTGDALASLNGGAWEAVEDHGHPQGLPFRVESYTVFIGDFEDGGFGGWSAVSTP